MDNLVLSVNVVLPLFLLMLIGYILKKRGFWDEKTLSNMNNICFRLFLPVMLFNNIYKTDIGNAFNLKLIIFAAATEIILFWILFFTVPRFEKINSRRGVLIQGMYRSNFILFGIPVSMALVGTKNIGCTSVLIASTIFIFNIQAVFVLDYFCGAKTDFRRVFRGILKNPLILAVIIGGGCKAVNITFPVFFETTLNQISNLATPIAFLVLGGTFKFQNVKAYTKQLVAAVSTRLIVIPAIFIIISVFFGFRKEELVALLCMYGSPTAVSSFTMAEQMGGDSGLAGQIVVFTCIFSIITMFIWIFILKQFCLI